MKAAENTVVHNFRVIALLEAIFTASLSHQTPPALGMQAGPVALLFVLCALARLALYWRLLEAYVGPSQELSRRVALGGSLGEGELRSADEKLQKSPRILATATALGYAVTFPLVHLLYRQFVGLPELPAYQAEVITTSSVSAIFGAVGIMMPLLAWTTAQSAGRNQALATERGYLLDRPTRSIAGRLVLMAVCLAGAPAVQMIGANIASEALSRERTSAQEVRALAAELENGARTKDGAAALEALGAHIDGARTSLFLVERNGAIRVTGRPLPTWAEAELLTRVGAGPVELPARGAALGGRRLADGRVIGALSTIAPLGSSFLLRLANEVMGLVLLSVVSAWLLSRSVALPLRQTAELTERAARQGDLSQLGSLPVAQNDEIGAVMTNLNELLGGMRLVAGAAGAVGEGKLGVELSGHGELPDAFRRMLSQLRGVVLEMSDTSGELASAATEIFAASQEQEAASTSHSTGMREIAQTMESLSDSAAHVATAVQGVLGNAERTLQNTDRMDSRIEDLTGHANRIGDILEVIRDIADRTDLLALNGSLEASRAGEAGVGFSLVASEMRRLAERVTASVADIKSLVSDIRESGASTVVATEESKTLADATTQAARSIALVTQQQQSSTEQVSQHVRSVAEVVQQAAAATTQTRASADNLKRHAERLTAAVARFQVSARV